MLSITTYITHKEDGSVKHQWLMTGSDDSTIRIWDIISGKCLEELVGHKNGVTSMTFANNQLFSGSYDHYIIVWDLVEIEEKIRECQIMAAEDLRSRKFEAFEEHMISKGKRKKPAKGKGKGKGKK